MSVGYSGEQTSQVVLLAGALAEAEFDKIPLPAPLLPPPLAAARAAPAPPPPAAAPPQPPAVPQQQIAAAAVPAPVAGGASQGLLALVPAVTSKGKGKAKCEDCGLKSKNYGAPLETVLAAHTPPVAIPIAAHQADRLVACRDTGRTKASVVPRVRCSSRRDHQNQVRECCAPAKCEEPCGWGAHCAHEPRLALLAAGR